MISQETPGDRLLCYHREVYDSEKVCRAYRHESKWIKLNH